MIIRRRKDGCLRSTVPSSIYFLLIFLILLSLLLLRAHATVTPNGYNCSADRTIYPCQAYALYRAATQPDLAAVGDLFGVSRAMLARASNLSSGVRLQPGQPLLVPLACSCGGSTALSYAPVEYQIAAGDTFYLVSTFKFANLTAYPAVEVVNPSLVPTDLDIGVVVTFPLFCQCPARNATNVLALVTYVFRPSDTFASIASSFGTDVPSLVSYNGPEASIKPFTTVLVPVTKMPPPLLLQHRIEPQDLQQPPPPPASLPTKKERDDAAVVGLAVALGLMGALWALLVLAVAWLWRRSSRFRRGGEEGGKGLRGGGGGGGGWRREGKTMRGFGAAGFASPSDEHLMADITELLDKYTVYKMEELRSATCDFDPSRLIEGSVYKGIIDGQVYAVKKMKWNACAELKILQKVNHTNLVKLEGFCINVDANSCYLVYEYVENGSLQSWLRNPAARQNLDWRARLRIALDLANGLQYIHEHTWPRVVHKDIKSSNVLLDTNMHAKIANFGLARTGLNAVTAHIVGTQGYIAPEYLADGLITTKMDVFAFGVILLELISGREAVNEAGEALWVEAEKVFEGRRGKGDGRLRTWMDTALVEQPSCTAESVATVMSIARACLHKDPAKRPNMVDVTYALAKADDGVNSDFSVDGLAGAAGGEVMAR